LIHRGSEGGGSGASTNIGSSAKARPRASRRAVSTDLGRVEATMNPALSEAIFSLAGGA
jgi:hypothetical protein